jgi:hypothetical protein
LFEELEQRAADVARFFPMEPTEPGAIRPDFRSPERIAELRAMPYGEYLQTPEWRRVRDLALRRAGFRCELPHCRSKVGLQVHHRDYDRIGEEVPEDLTVLCGVCHDGWHHGLIPGLERDPLAVYVALAYEVLKAKPAPDSISEFAGAVKDHCYRLRLPYKRHQVEEALQRMLRTLESDPFGYLPIIPPLLLPPAAPSISHSEAVDLLADISRETQREITVRPMAKVRELSPEEILERNFEAEKRRAYLMVQQAILDQAQRVAELEAKVEATEPKGEPRPVAPPSLFPGEERVTRERAEIERMTRRYREEG